MKFRKASLQQMLSSEVTFGLREDSPFYKIQIKIQLVFNFLFSFIITYAILIQKLLSEESALSNPHCLRNNVAFGNSKRKVSFKFASPSSTKLPWMLYNTTLDFHKYFKAIFNIIFVSTFGSILYIQPKCGTHFPFSIACPKSHLLLP